MKNNQMMQSDVLLTVINTQLWKVDSNFKQALHNLPLLFEGAAYEP